MKLKSTRLGLLLICLCIFNAHGHWSDSYSDQVIQDQIHSAEDETFTIRTQMFSAYFGKSASTKLAQIMNKVNAYKKCKTSSKKSILVGAYAVDFDEDTQIVTIQGTYKCE
ncbi:MAG: hypothetical protein HOE90_15500 [Bacteriovoracaceae bacterium]|nr:hypothetical protein [Bacteriovoracaceae bacterium]